MHLCECKFLLPFEGLGKEESKELKRVTRSSLCIPYSYFRSKGMTLSGYAGILEVIDQRCLMSKPAQSFKAHEKTSRVNMGCFRNEVLLKSGEDGKQDWIK